MQLVVHADSHVEIGPGGSAVHCRGEKDFLPSLENRNDQIVFTYNLL